MTNPKKTSARNVGPLEKELKEMGPQTEEELFGFFTQIGETVVDYIPGSNYIRFIVDRVKDKNVIAIFEPSDGEKYCLRRFD